MIDVEIAELWKTEPLLASCGQCSIAHFGSTKAAADLQLPLLPVCAATHAAAFVCRVAGAAVAMHSSAAFV